MSNTLEPRDKAVTDGCPTGQCCCFDGESTRTTLWDLVQAFLNGSRNCVYDLSPSDQAWLITYAKENSNGVMHGVMHIKAANVKRLCEQRGLLTASEHQARNDAVKAAKAKDSQRGKARKVKAEGGENTSAASAAASSESAAGTTSSKSAKAASLRERLAQLEEKRTETLQQLAQLNKRSAVTILSCLRRNVVRAAKAEAAEAATKAKAEAAAKAEAEEAATKAKAEAAAKAEAVEAAAKAEAEEAATKAKAEAAAKAEAEEAATKAEAEAEAATKAKLGKRDSSDSSNGNPLKKPKPAPGADAASDELSLTRIDDTTSTSEVLVFVKHDHTKLATVHVVDADGGTEEVEVWQHNFKRNIVLYAKETGSYEGMDPTPYTLETRFPLRIKDFEGDMIVVGPSFKPGDSVVVKEHYEQVDEGFAAKVTGVDTTNRNYTLQSGRAGKPVTVPFGVDMDKQDEGACPLKRKRIH